jgi:hypothetical protein
MVKTPPTVRILPMDSQNEEFPGWRIEDVQSRFFLGALQGPPNPGRYRYRAQGLDSPPNSVVLFQFASHIIASAVLLRIERYQQPDGPYRGALWFEPSSVCVFQPVGADGVHKHWPDGFAGFSQVRWELDPSSYPAFEHDLSDRVWPTQRAPLVHDLNPPLAERVKTLVSRIVRDTQLTNYVKMLHNYECQICGQTINIGDGSRYAEGHHMQPLGSPHDGPDVMENIVCLCPNHHAACDLGAIHLDLRDLRSAPGHSVAQHYIDYHNKIIHRS